jgi:SAM-dependent methyltransferase
MYKMKNQYTDMIDYYDLLMTSGYHDYDERARALAALLPENPKVIEIGVGTGLVLEKLLELNPQYNLTGLDHTPAMLKIAKERLGDRAKLIQADMVTQSIPEEFDVAFSHGGLCAFVDTGSAYDFYSHLTDEETNVQALKNIAAGLKSGGLFVMSIRGVHNNYDQLLPDGIVYTQEIVESTTYEGCIEKTFYFTKDDELLAKQRNIYGIFKGEDIEDIFSRANFKLEGEDQSGLFRIYSKA